MQINEDLLYLSSSFVQSQRVKMYSLVGSQCTAGGSGSCGLWSLCQKIEDFIGDLKAAIIGDGLEAVVDSKEHPPN